MEYYAKSANRAGNPPTVKEHLSEVSKLAEKYGKELCLGESAKLAGLLHDFGKYSSSFQDVLIGKKHYIDHAIAGACLLRAISKNKSSFSAIIEAINGHHDGLKGEAELVPIFRDIINNKPHTVGNNGKEPAILGGKGLQESFQLFRNDFPDFRDQLRVNPFHGSSLESMLYTRMLFSCLVDADYSVSACDNDPTYLLRTDSDSLDPKVLLEKLYRYRDEVKYNSRSDPVLNHFRDEVFETCGKAGEETEGLFTLTAPTGTGKTLALMHFALRHCLAHEKSRIIIVLPFLTLAEQNSEIYGKIVPGVLIDHSQSDLPENAKELAARWTAPVIITTSVRFFEALFSDRPTACRKLHNIANSVVVFDEAQSLPANLTDATLQTVNALCSRYHTTMVFSTATQPDYSTLKGTEWKPREILPSHKKMYDALQRVNVDWRIKMKTPLSKIAEEMALQSSVCAIVNLRRHARELTDALIKQCPEEEVFFLTTDLCPAHRRQIIEHIKERLNAGFPCRVVATQCIEAGVDLDFQVLYRALAPLDAIIQAAGRCNRNGSILKGQVIVFDPDDDRAYPDAWYENAAIKVKEMQPPFSIHDPANIREYYRRLFAEEKGNADLNRAIDSRSFEDAARFYKLISNHGVQVIVPFSGERERYARVSKALREHGITGAVLKDAAPITVTCFVKGLEACAERIPFAGSSPKDNVLSNVFLLFPQNEGFYSDRFGLRFPEEAQGSFIF